jgi:hypothetical protein
MVPTSTAKHGMAILFCTCSLGTERHGRRMLCSLALVQGLMFIISRWSGWLRDEKENTEHESSLSNADWLLEMFDKLEEKMLWDKVQKSHLTRSLYLSVILALCLKQRKL